MTTAPCRPGGSSVAKAHQDPAATVDAAIQSRNEASFPAVDITSIEALGDQKERRNGDELLDDHSRWFDVTLPRQLPLT